MLTFKPLTFWQRMKCKWMDAFFFADGGIYSPDKSPDWISYSITPIHPNVVFHANFRKPETDEYQRQQFMKNLARSGHENE